MKYRKLRIAFSAVCGVLCLLLIALWVRSYWRLEILQTPINSQAFQLSSVKGRIAVAHVAAYSKSGERYSNVAAGDAADWRKEGAVSFAYHSDSFVTALIVPHWFVGLVASAFAVIPWVYQSWRFSLRTLLIATTVVAVLLGAVVWAAR